MKVVLFCGGLGTRLREHSNTIPKPLVPIGTRPIIWHLMKYYAHHGHKDFVLCLGFKGEMLREYFLNYNPYLTKDFSIHPGGVTSPTKSDIDAWKITFVDTGLHANIGQRLLRVREHLKDEEVFLANYSDQVSDLPLQDHLDQFKDSGALASFVAVPPPHSFHAVSVAESGLVNGMTSAGQSDFRINGGYMILRQDIFDHIEDGDELVEAPFSRLIAKQQLHAYRYDGFWAAMDTFKDKIMFDRMHGSEDCPWEIWND